VKRGGKGARLPEGSHSYCYSEIDINSIIGRRVITRRGLNGGGTMKKRGEGEKENLMKGGTKSTGRKKRATFLQGGFPTFAWSFLFQGKRKGKDNFIKRK